MSIDPNNLGATAHLTFDDEFNNLSLWSPSNPGGTWATTYPYQDPNGNGGTLASNGEQEWYINSNYGPTSSIRPWQVNNGILTLTATPVSSDVSALINGYGYTSGEVNTFHSFSQTYGYFEMRAQLPSGQGFWPAFWLMPTNGAWPPELDVMEVLGQNTQGLVTTVHSNNLTDGKEGQWTQVADMSAGYHTFGVDWEPDYITWYFDGQAVSKYATPSDLNSPMYIIANLADGGYWPGPANGQTGHMNIDYIRAYASGPSSGSGSGSGGGSTGSSGGSSPSVTVSDSSYTAPSGVTTITLSGSNQTVQANSAGDTIYSNNSQNHLLGGSGNDTFYMGCGGDSAASGGGTDLFVFQQVPWAGGHITGFAGQDALDLQFLTTYHYTGSNPIADGRITLVSDGNGGTQVWAHLDGLSGVHGDWLVTTIDGVSPANLSWQNGRLVDPPSSGGSTGSSSGTAGQTFTSDNNGDHWTGTAGNDTFNLGRGADVVTGNGGADTFVYHEYPWAAAGHITDFGSDDVLDLSPMFARYGYTGSNPLADGHLKFVSDGNGGTQVWFDGDGLPVGNLGSWLVTDLDHVSASSLTISSGRITTSGSTASSGGSSSGTAGQTFTSDNNGDHWTGTAGNDTFNLGRGADVVTGNGGADTFVYHEYPWAAAGHITDFGADDVLDLSPMFARYGYTGSDPLADGHLKFVSDGNGGTQVWFDGDGLPVGNLGSWLVTDLDHVAPSSLGIASGRITETGSSSAAVTGQTFTSDNAGDHFTGTAGNDVFNVGRGGDWLTGNGGNDSFVFHEYPWANTHIADFGPGDTLDLSAMLTRYGYTGSNPVGDGRIQIASDGSDGAQIWFHGNGLPVGNLGDWQVADLQHVNPANLHVNGAFITG